MEQGEGGQLCPGGPGAGSESHLHHIIAIMTLGGSVNVSEPQTRMRPPLWAKGTADLAGCGEARFEGITSCLGVPLTSLSLALLNFKVGQKWAPAEAAGGSGRGTYTTHNARHMPRAPSTVSKQASKLGHASHVQTQPCLWDHHTPGFKEHKNQAALGGAETSIPAPPALAHL